MRGEAVPIERAGGTHPSTGDGLPPDRNDGREPSSYLESEATMDRGMRAVRDIASKAGAKASLESGQALVEYALILMLIAIVAVGVLTALGHGVSTMISKAAGAF
jgi:Flp pilus assembly pilin Flp